ncbi:MAG: GNAT family N-acetyltransferase [Gemmatimonadales bacterium]
MGLMIRRAIERGFRSLDLLRGDEPYKMEWTQTARRCSEIAVFRDGWRGATLRGLDRIQRPLRGKGLSALVHRCQRRLVESWRLAKHRQKAVSDDGVHG